MIHKDKKWWNWFYSGLVSRAVELKVSSPPEVDHPTYKVVGEIHRVDQRDTVQFRMVLKPETSEYEEYYGRHRGMRDWDDRNRETLKSSIQHHREADPLGAHFVPAVFSIRAMLGDPHIVRGQSESSSHWVTAGSVAKNSSPEELTSRMKSLALFLGASKVRVTRLKKA